MTFAEQHIQKIDSCSVYHAGPDYVVELDIVMDPETPLWKAHDISQALQVRSLCFLEVNLLEGN